MGSIYINIYSSIPDTMDVKLVRSKNVNDVKDHPELNRRRQYSGKVQEAKH